MLPETKTVVRRCSRENIKLSSGRRNLRVRNPELYAKLTEPLPERQKPEVNPGWRLKTEDQKQN